MIFDVAGALVSLYGVIRKDHELQDWLRLILSSVFSGFIALTGVWGAALVAHVTPWPAFGSGLCACATAVLTILLRMKQGRSLMIAMPNEVEKQYEAAGQSIVEPVDKK